MENIKQVILNYVIDLVTDFTYYDRKEDEELTEEILDSAIKNEDVSISEIVETFKNELENVYNRKQ